MIEDVVILDEMDEVSEDERFSSEFNCGHDNCDGEIDIDYDPDIGGFKGVCPKCGRIYKLIPDSYKVESEPGDKSQEAC